MFQYIMTKDTAKDIQYDNKGYVMSYDDFLKVIEKYKRHNKDCKNKNKNGVKEEDKRVSIADYLI